MFSTRSLLIAALVAFLAGLVASLALRPGDRTQVRVPSNETSQVVRHKWRMPMHASRNLPGSGETPTWLTETLEKSSDGAFIIEMFDPGELVPVFAITEAVRDRKVQAGWTWLGYDQGRIPSSALIAATPFGMEPVAYVGWWLFSDGQKLAEKIYGEHNIKPILCAISGPETAGWFSQPLKSAEDLNGLKIRFAGIGGKVLQRLGASVTMIPSGEIFQALETGVIDATEYAQPITDKALGFSRIAKFNYFPGWHQPFSTAHLVVNLDVWEGMTSSDQSLLESSCLASVMFNLSLTDTLQGPILKEFENEGVSTLTLPPELLTKLRNTANSVLDEEASKDAFFKEMLSSQRAYQADYDRWRGLAYLPPSRQAAQN